MSKRKADGAERIIHDLELRQLELEARCRELERRCNATESVHARYAEFYDSIPIACCRLDLDGRIEQANNAAAATFGLCRSSLLGKQLWTLAGPAARHELHGHVASCLTHRRRVSSEVELYVADLGPVPHQVISVPFTGLDGRVLGCRTVLNDITSLKRAEQRLGFLARASALLSATFDTRTNIAAVVRDAVPAFGDLMFGDFRDELGVTMRTEVAFAEARHAGLAEGLRRAPAPALELAEAELFTVAAPAALALAIGDCPQRTALVHAIAPRSVMLVPVMARGETLGGLTFVMADSGRVHTAADLEVAADLANRIAMAMDNARLYREARRAVNARQEILSIVSHDLKTPLAGIQLIADAMLRVTPPTERRKSRGHLERIRSSAAQLRKIVDDLLDASSIDAGRLSIDPHEHALSDLIKEALELLEPHAQDKAIELACAGIPEGLWVHCDRQRVLQVFANVIGNAVKFTPPGGRVTLSADFHEGMARISVRDSGPGVPPPLLARLFERYAQATQTAAKGNGLGLYISKGLVEAQGGTIWMESASAQGACVHFTLPPAQPAAPTREASRSQQLAVHAQEPLARA